MNQLRKHNIARRAKFKSKKAETDKKGAKKNHFIL